jgi:hypothetical protein
MRGLVLPQGQMRVSKRASCAVPTIVKIEQLGLI